MTTQLPSAPAEGLGHDPWYFARWAREIPVQHQTQKGVLLILASYAEGFTGLCFPSQQILAEKMGLSVRHVRRVLEALEDQGRIARRPRCQEDGARSSDAYLVLAPGVSHWPDGAPSSERAVPLFGSRWPRTPMSAGHGCPPNYQRPSSTKNGNGRPTTSEATDEVTTPLELGEAQGRRPLKFRKKTVPRPLQERAEGVLEDYCEKTGQRHRPYRSDGRPSECLSRILRAVMDFPDLGREELAGTIDRTLSSRWWGEGSPSVGVVFGERVFEDNLMRDPRPVGGGREAERSRRTQERLALIDGLRA